MPRASPMVERFWPKVNKTKTCWLWTGSKNNKGYGQIARGAPAPRNKKMVYAHRVSYEMVNGPIPEGLSLDHLCRMPSCVNPAHLEAVTHKENTLRGVGFAAVNARKTHCPKGHPLSGENLCVPRMPWRICKECLRVSALEFRKRQKK